jgi:hypothetical protein
MMFVADPGVSTRVLSWTLRAENWKGGGRYQDAFETSSGMSFGPAWELRPPGCDEPANSPYSTNGVWNVGWPLGRLAPDVSFDGGGGTVELTTGESLTVDVLAGVVSEFAPLDPATFAVTDPATLGVELAGTGTVTLTAPADAPDGPVLVRFEVCNTAQFCSPFTWTVNVVSTPTPETVPETIPDETVPETIPDETVPETTPDPTPEPVLVDTPPDASPNAARLVAVSAGVLLLVASALAWFVLVARRSRRQDDTVDLDL